MEFTEAVWLGSIKVVLDSWLDNREAVSSPLEDCKVLKEAIRHLDPEKNHFCEICKRMIVVMSDKRPQTDAIRWEATDFLRCIMERMSGVDHRIMEALVESACTDTNSWVIVGTGRILESDGISFAREALKNRMICFVADAVRKFRAMGGEPALNARRKELKALTDELNKSIAAETKRAEKELFAMRGSLSDRKTHIKKLIKEGFPHYFPFLREHIQKARMALRGLEESRLTIDNLNQLLGALQQNQTAGTG